MRRLLNGFILLFCLTAGLAAQAAQVTATRVWPAPDYTRITLEAASELHWSHFQLSNPERLVIDLSGSRTGPVFDALTAADHGPDPYISGVRVAPNRPGVVRVVIDLKQAVAPSVFTLPPQAEFGHRLVIDLRPRPLAPGLNDQLARPADPPAARPPAPRSDPVVARAARKYDRLVTVAIDPGHGGTDPGAIGSSGSREKDITLALAHKLKARFDGEPNMRAVLTREGDYFVPLSQRVAKARAAEADLFMSIHADAFIKPHARGSSVFALSENGASSVAARWLAKRENDADLIGGVNIDVKDQHLKRTLIDLTQTATIDHSLKLGRAVLKKMGGVNTLHKPHVEQAGFAVLKAPDIPSILVETAFISNPEEEKRLNDAAYQDKLIDAIFEGVRDYLAKHPPAGPQRLTRNP